MLICFHHFGIVVVVAAAAELLKVQ